MIYVSINNYFCNTNVTMLKKIIKYFFKLFGKRLTPLNSPAKPFEDGVSFLKRLIDSPVYIIDIGYADGTPDLTNSFPLDSYNYLLIEANPQFYNNLDLVEADNSNVIIEKCFCAEKSGEDVSLNISNQGYQSSIYRSPGKGNSIRVPTKSLDSITKKYHIAGPLLIKIDVEGSEINVLRGAVNTLTKADVVILETWISVPDSKSPGDFARIVEFMDANNFVVFDFFGGHSHNSGVLAHIDTVFVKRNSKYRNILD